jgi:hypothetical protein
MAETSNFRGETEVSLNNKTWKLIPSLGALMEYEDIVGKPALDCMNMFRTEEGPRIPPMKYIIAAIYCGVKWGFSKDRRHLAPSMDTVTEWIQNAGFGLFVDRAFHFVVYSLFTDKQIQELADKKAKREAEGTVEVSPLPQQTESPAV